MGRLFNLDSPIMQWLQKFSVVIFCGFFWLLLCIPVITAGAATTAMHRQMFNLRENRIAGVKDFFSTFRREFKKSTLLWLIELLFAGVLLVLYLFLPGISSGDVFWIILSALFMGLVILWMFSCLFVFPLTAYFENSITGTLKNSLLLALGNLRHSLPVLILAAAPFSLCIFILMLNWTLFYYLVLCILPVWVFVFIPFAAYLQSRHFILIFSRYEPDMQNEEAPAE